MVGTLVESCRCVVLSMSRYERRMRAAQILGSDEELEALFEVISAGESLRDYCIVMDVPYATIQEALVRDHNTRYVAAMHNRAEVRRERIEAIIKKVEEGQMDPKAGAVTIGGLQWLAKVDNRKRFGDQQQIDVAVTDKTKLLMEAMKRFARMPRKQVQAEVVQASLPAPPSDNVMDAAFTEVAEIKAPGGMPI